MPDRGDDLETMLEQERQDRMRRSAIEKQQQIEAMKPKGTGTYQQILGKNKAAIPSRTLRQKFKQENQ